jgi:hypothetical protein
MYITLHLITTVGYGQYFNYLFHFLNVALFLYFYHSELLDRVPDSM